DIGKIGVPDNVLAKPDRLDDDEWEMMKQHPVTGASIVRHLPGFHRLELGILHHHERIDGSGYPSGLTGDDIPVESKIIAVADTYSAMTTSRPYRERKRTDEAI